MENQMSAKLRDLFYRLTSRKFLMSVIGIGLVIYFPDNADSVIKILALFIGLEGAADVASRIKKSGNAITFENVESQNVEIPVDTSVIVSGKPDPTPLFNEEPSQ
jgi:hypothetical protein